MINDSSVPFAVVYPDSESRGHYAIEWVDEQWIFLFQEHASAPWEEIGPLTEAGDEIARLKLLEHFGLTGYAGELNRLRLSFLSPDKLNELRREKEENLHLTPAPDAVTDYLDCHSSVAA